MTKKQFRECLEAEVFKNCNHTSSLGRKTLRWVATYLSPSTNAVYLIRRMQLLNSSHWFNRIRSRLIHFKLIRRYGIHIYPNTKIGCGLHLPHPTSIVVGARVIVGTHCTLYQNTTIGGRHKGDVKKGNQPVIGNNCTLFAGSTILGGVIIGDNCTIGAHFLLITDAENNSVYVGAPAKKV